MLMCLSPLSQVNQFRQLYAKVINDKHDDVMAKFGAILAQGVLDAGRPLQITPTPPNNPNTPTGSSLPEWQRQQLDLIRKRIHLLVSDGEGGKKKRTQMVVKQVNGCNCSFCGGVCLRAAD